MSTIELISLALNGVLAIGLVALALRARRLLLDADGRRSTTEAERDAARQEAGSLRREYSSLAQGVADTLGAVRHDIDANYRHTHERDLLDRLACEIEKAGGPVVLDAGMADEIRKRGGERFIAGEMLLLSGALGLAWHLHARARKAAGDLGLVIQESCGHTERAPWLAKTLALYLRICGGDQEAAVASLGDVLERWRRVGLPGAVYTTHAKRS